MKKWLLNLKIEVEPHLEYQLREQENAEQEWLKKSESIMPKPFQDYIHKQQTIREFNSHQDSPKSANTTNFVAIKEQQKSKGSNQTNLAYDMYSFVEPSGGGAKSEKARKTSFDVATP